MSLETIVIIFGVICASCLYSIYQRVKSLDDNFHNWYVDWNRSEERYEKSEMEKYSIAELEK